MQSEFNDLKHGVRTETLKGGVKVPTYTFRCDKCDENFETIESIKSYDGDGECPKCKNISREVILSANIHFIGASVQNAEYNPGLGQVVKNKKHREELAKRRGLIEVGNEKTSTLHKMADETRAERIKKSWDEV
jgi:putative FmdB family regulatory protein